MQKLLYCRRAVSLYELVEVQELYGSLMPVEEGHVDECERADEDLRSCSHFSVWIPPIGIDAPGAPCLMTCIIRGFPSLSALQPERIEAKVTILYGRPARQVGSG